MSQPLHLRWRTLNVFDILHICKITSCDEDFLTQALDGLVCALAGNEVRHNLHGDLFTSLSSSSSSFLSYADDGLFVAASFDENRKNKRDCTAMLLTSSTMGKARRKRANLIQSASLILN